jgi:F420-non-reducing hydrogenase iron-sulfur subunit
MGTGAEPPSESRPKILVIATALCSYPGVDAVGQTHLEYPSNCCVIKCLDPVLFPEDFYLGCFAKGIDGIIVASCGTDCPYEGAYEKTAARIDRVYRRMREQGLDPKRLRLTAICSVCTKAFLREAEGMNRTLEELGPVQAADAANE